MFHHATGRKRPVAFSSACADVGPVLCRSLMLRPLLGGTMQRVAGQSRRQNHVVCG